MIHIIPLNTSVSFRDNYGIYIVTDYIEVLSCAADCALDHDHYEEPYITVRQETRRAFPLSQLDLIFDPVTHLGHPATDAQKRPHLIGEERERMMQWAYGSGPGTLAGPDDL